jgi:uncharacterized membrane protein YbhN (UPF0104 family)
VPSLVEIASIAVLALLAARVPAPSWRRRALAVLKVWVTVRAFWLLLSHPVALQDGSREAASGLVVRTVLDVGSAPFWTFCAIAAGVKFVGTLAAMFRWTILLRGQSIDLPFRHIFGSFLIGRFVGVLLPGSIGLDGYKLYDAARFSGRTVEVAVTTVAEKAIAVSGVLLAFLVAVPFAIEALGTAALRGIAVLVPVALGLLGAVILVLWHPGTLHWVLRRLPLPAALRAPSEGARLAGVARRAQRSAAAYRDARDLVLAACGLSLVAQLATAAMLYFTALALGAAAAEFWPIALGASTQSLDALLAPLGAGGEALREATRGGVLREAVGPAQAAVAAALGFWAAEGLTLVGGFFWWMRPAGHRPLYCLVDGRQVVLPEAPRETASAGKRAPLARPAAGELLRPRVGQLPARAGR